jgi:hypothetical protein
MVFSRVMISAADMEGDMEGPTRGVVKAGTNHHAINRDANRIDRTEGAAVMAGEEGDPIAGEEAQAVAAGTGAVVACPTKAASMCHTTA